MQIEDITQKKSTTMKKGQSEERVEKWSAKIRWAYFFYPTFLSTRSSVLTGCAQHPHPPPHPPSKKKLDHFLYKDFHRFSWEICASILITRLWLKGFFKWTAGSTRTQEAKWRCYHPPIRTLYIMKYLIPFLTRFFANVNLFWAFSSISAHYPSETSRKTGIYPSLYQKHILPIFPPIFPPIFWL